MKKIIIVIACYFISIVTLLAIVPKYTSLENATKLAIILKNASIGEDNLVSIDLKKISGEQYYLEGITNRGKIYLLYINYLQRVLKYEKLFIANNKMIIFLSPKSSSFVILDKKSFLTSAFSANSYLKIYKGDDPLSGRNVLQKIKSIDVTPYGVKNNRFGIDNKGNYYHYSIELHNGEKELLTYKDAYKLLEEQRLLTALAPEIPAIDRVNTITDFRVNNLNVAVDNPNFSIIITFDQDNLLTEEQIGFEFIELKGTKDYQLLISIPNSTVSQNFSKINDIEYLKDISLTNDKRYISRTVLKTKYNPLLTDVAPQISRIDKRDLVITFFYRGNTAIQGSKSLTPATFITRSASLGQTDFLKTIDKYQTILLKIRNAGDIKVVTENTKKLIFDINQEAITVSNDINLSQLFKIRRQARGLGYVKIVNFVKKEISSNRENLNLENIIQYLSLAEELATGKSQIESVRELKSNL